MGDIAIVLATDSVATRSASGAGEPPYYFAVLIPALTALPDLHCDLYLQAPDTSRKVLYRGADCKVALADDERLAGSGVSHLYLREEDRPRYELALANAKAPRDSAARLALTIELSRERFKTALLTGSPASIVSSAQETAGQLLQVVSHHGFALKEAMALLDHDRCTFQHSCNVSLYAATLAKRVGLPDHELEQIIVAGMVHDLGKRHIPPYILRKPGALDERERALIRRHPTRGFLELAPLGQLNRRQLMMVYQHHERIDGAGYPVGSAGDEIDHWARICAIVDVFDALTAHRSYRGTSTVAEAVGIMKGENGHFDKELLALWTETVR